MSLIGEALRQAGVEDETILWVSSHYSASDVVLDIDGDHLALTHEQARALAAALMSATFHDVDSVIALTTPPLTLTGGRIRSGDPFTAESHSH